MVRVVAWPGKHPGREPKLFRNLRGLSYVHTVTGNYMAAISKAKALRADLILTGSPEASLVNTAPCPVAYVELRSAEHVVDDPTEYIARFDSIWMLSQGQKAGWRNRFPNYPKVAGYMSPHPSWTAGQQVSQAFYPVVSSGKSVPRENVFAVHTLFDNDPVITSVALIDEVPCPYWENNKRWMHPRINYLYEGKSDKFEVLKHAGVYFSAYETDPWGEEILDALSFGLQVVCMSGLNWLHNSKELAAAPDHIKLVGDFGQARAAILEAWSDTTIERRREIACETQTKHNVEKWDRQIERSLRDAATL